MITNKLTKIFEESFIKNGFDRKYALVVISDRPDISDFQCNGALALAKILGKNPRDIANSIIEKINKDYYFEDVFVEGPGFINIKLSKEYILDYIININNDPLYGINQVGKGKTIFMDYGGPNIAKPLHIGHLRSAVIGESIKRIANSVGAKTIADVHLGDWGLQIGLVILGLTEKHGDNLLNKKITIDELEEIYPAASKKSEEDEDYKNKAREITKQLQEKDEYYFKVWEKLYDLSVTNIKLIYEKLNVSFDYWNGEQSADKYIDSLLQILEEKKLLKESEGALIVDLKEESDNQEMPPIIIKKNDGSFLYSTTDLAALIGRVKEHNPTDIWYVVDNRQSLHFKQVFRCANKANITNNVNLEHLGFGTMNGKDNKPYKTREGGIMRLMDFYKIVYDEIYDKVKSFNKDEVTDNLTVATIKFGDLINYREKDYIFDLEKFTQTEGKTGSFLLYTVARINSILEKVENTPYNLNIYSDTEKNILLKLMLSSEVLVNSFNNKAPNILADHAYQLASLYSKFYMENHILNEDNLDKMESWITLSKLVKKYLEFYLDLLGIKTVYSM